MSLRKTALLLDSTGELAHAAAVVLGAQQNQAAHAGAPASLIVGHAQQT